MPVRDARVDDRDADAGAVDAEVLADPGRADGRAGTLQRAVHAAVEPDARSRRGGRPVRRAPSRGFPRPGRGASARRRPGRPRSDRIEAVGRRAVGGLDDDPRRPALRVRAGAQGGVQLVVAAVPGPPAPGRPRRQERQGSDSRQSADEEKRTSNHFAGWIDARIPIARAGAIVLPAASPAVGDSLFDCANGF